MNIASATARTVTWMDTVYTINVDRYQSGGIVGVFESIVPARGGPPVHVHHNEDEVIHVIEGGYEFWLDGDTIPVAAGASIFLPRGVPHTFRVTSTSSGRNLTILTPGEWKNSSSKRRRRTCGCRTKGPKSWLLPGAMASNFSLLQEGTIERSIQIYILNNDMSVPGLVPSGARSGSCPSRAVRASSDGPGTGEPAWAS
ncbi:MAG: cupin domain-containing protein [Xanthobacteraceae bacterium]|nr:cupin domain-containing protein [Xanthobacteraceae bacterium]